MENNVVKKPRLEWLDALRGFTMILVVAYHVAEMGFGESWRHSSSMPFLVLFRMPLFFFVSGFLAYKASQVWDFRYYQQYFTKFTIMGVSLQYVGRRTLDIYLIHFLFMPDLPQIGEFFKSYPHNFVVDILLSVLLGLVVIGFCIIASNILRISPFFKKWLFGRG